jgi:hypothetical protein
MLSHHPSVGLFEGEEYLIFGRKAEVLLSFASLSLGEVCCFHILTEPGTSLSLKFMTTISLLNSGSSASLYVGFLGCSCLSLFSWCRGMCASLLLVVLWLSPLVILLSGPFACGSVPPFSVLWFLFS